MSKAFKNSISYLVAIAALSSVAANSAQAAPDPVAKDAAIAEVKDPANMAIVEPKIADAKDVKIAETKNTAIADLINRQENAVNLQLNPAANSPVSGLAVDQLAETAEVASVTSVSQLSDVRPTDWAFTALQSLVERYGCIAGYPDSTFRGGKALSRYEFAAGLNACLDKINEIIAAGLADKVSKEDLAALQKLQEEFAAELSTLRGRVDALDKKVATLEAQQFSPTTKLSGLAFFNLTGATAGSPVTRETGGRVGGVGAPLTETRTNPNVTFSYYLFLTLTTSFTGKDALVTQLVTGNGNSPANRFVSDGFFNSWGTPFLDQTGVPTANQFNIRELFYSFPVSDSVTMAVGPRINFYRYFDGNRFTNFLTGATSFNSNGSTLSNSVDRGSGAVVTWTLSPQFRWTTAYLAENTEFLNPTVSGNNTSSDPKFGLFGGTNTISTELVYSPSRDANIRLMYTRSNIQPNQTRNGNLVIGGATAEPVPYGIVDDGVGGAVNTSTADTIVFNFDWLLSKNFGLFGRYSYGNTNVSPVSAAVKGGSIAAHSVQFGLAFPDLFKEGSLGVLSFVVPHIYGGGTQFLRSGRGNGATQYDLELSYYYPISNNIAIVPAVYAIFNPNSFSTNPTVFVGNLRTQFRF